MAILTIEIIYGKYAEMKLLSKSYCYLLLFLIGGSVYYTLEIISRGHSHYSMFFAGGLSLALINSICNKSKFLKNKNIILKALTGGIIITAIELVVGIMFNMFLEMKIWDYSSLPLNVFGQICLPFTLLWIILSFPALFICKIIDKPKK